MPLPKSKAAVGAKVMYCGHAGWFVADIIRVGNVLVVRAPDPVAAGTLIRHTQGVDTHHLSDFPGPNFWRPDLGVFVVPASQVTRLK